MTSHLARLALRATRPGTGLRPRPLALFEEPGGDSRRTEYDGPGPLPAPPPRRSAPDSPAPASASPVPTLGAAAVTASEAVSVAARRPEPVPASAPGNHAQAEQHGSPLREMGATGEAAPDAAPIRGHFEALPPRVEAEPSRPVQGQRAGHGLLSTAVVPVAAEQAAEEPPRRADSAPRSHEPPAREAGDPVYLPRLTPVSRSEPATEPTITVTIGRIEVLPPAEPRKRTVPAKERRTETGAPNLAEYLRDRSRR